MIKVAYVVGTYPGPERQRRIDVALSYATAEVQVGIVDVEATPYVHGLTPGDLALVAPLFMDAYKRAQAAGYDAVVPLGTLELGVEGGRSVVDIPVIGPTQATLHVAAQVGDRFGMICYHERYFPIMRDIVRRYRMSDFVGGWRASDFDLPDLAANHDRLVENFVSAARSLIKENGCDVIIPMGISQCPVHMKPDWLMRELGVPVVEAIGSPILMAGIMAKMGLHPSRHRWPEQGKPR